MRLHKRERYWNETLKQEVVTAVLLVRAQWGVLDLDKAHFKLETKDRKYAILYVRITATLMVNTRRGWAKSVC